MSLQTHLDKYGPWAIVAGGAKGLGRAFCEQLLLAGKNVIAIDHDPRALRTTCTELDASYDQAIVPEVLDLATPEAAKRVMELARAHSCRLFVYNAAYGPVRRFEFNTEEELDIYIDLNTRTLLHLAWWFAREMDHSVPAGFLSVSSMAGIRGTLLVAPYAGTKAFIWNLMESLHYEYKGTSLDFAAMCAGPVSTENYLGTKPHKTALLPKPDTPAYVAEKALRQLGKRPVDVPGFGNRVSEFILTKLMPRQWASAINNKVMAKSYPQHWNP